MNEETAENEKGLEVKLYTKKEIRAFVSDIEAKLVSEESPVTHSLVAVNHLLRLPNAEELFDGKIKERLKDIWLKLKSSGLELQDPPILFGLPENFESLAEGSFDDIADDEELAVSDSEEILEARDETGDEKENELKKASKASAKDETVDEIVDGRTEEEVGGAEEP